MEDTLKQSNRKGSRVQKNTAAEKFDQENQASKPQVKKSSKTENDGEQETGTVISNKSGARKTAKVNGASESNEAHGAENGKAEEEMRTKIKREEDTEINGQGGEDRHVSLEKDTNTGLEKNVTKKQHIKAVKTESCHTDAENHSNENAHCTFLKQKRGKQVEVESEEKEELNTKEKIQPETQRKK